MVAAFDSGMPQPFADGTTTVQFRAIAGVVAPAKYARAALDEKEVGEYTRVLEEVQAATAVLPAPPGTVFKTRDNLARWLELHYFTLTQALGSIEGHGQARLTITKTPGIDAADATVGELKESSKQLLATASQSMRVLRGQAAATVSLPVPEEDTHIVAHASFLVDLEQWAVFADLVRGTGLLASQVEDALWELVAAGIITADGFENLRSLIDPKRRRGFIFT